MFDKNEFKKFATKHMGINSLTYDQYAHHAVRSMDVQNLTPYVIEERQLNVTSMDVFSRLMMDRIIFLGTGINSEVANIVQAQLLFLESTDPKRDVSLFINSPGGGVYAGLGIYDTMQYIAPDVVTICTGIAASMGMIHQPLGGAQGQSSDMEITVREIVKLREELYTIISNHSGQKYEKVEKDSNRDFWMRSEEAKEYGMIDEVLTRKKEGKK